jgi:peptide/nickel transport system ATP-binding protein
VTPLLRVSGLQAHYVSFGGSRVVRAVDGVSFTLREGETIGLIGESGCGKTTTCLSIVGLLPPAARIVGGNIEFEGEELTTKRPREMRRIRGRRIAMILQDPMASLNPLFSVYWQVAEPAYHHMGMRGRSLRQRVQELLRAVRIAAPAVRMGEYPHQMSGGMRQRVVGAIAMAGGPRLIIADEPTTNLDVTIQAQYLDVLKDIQEETGVALIFVTHNLGIVAKMCDKMAVMSAGKIVEQGSVRDLFRAAKHPYTQALLGSMPKLGSKEPLYAIPGHPPISPSCHRAAHSTRVALMRCRSVLAGSLWIAASVRIGQRDAGYWIDKRKKNMPAPLLELQNLQKYFPVSTGALLRRKLGWVKAVDGVDFAVWPGETLGLIGESGCGKTTTSKLILLQETPTAGTIRFGGEDIAGLQGQQLMRYRREVQVVFQDPYSSLSPRMRVGDIVAEPLEIHTDLSREGLHERVAEVLELVGLQPEVARLFPHEFSGGQRQRIAIARALATQTRLIVLDEPVSALDVSIRAQIMNQLEHLQQTLGVSYLFIGHDLATVAHISHRIAVMYLGQIVELADSLELCARPLHPYTQALFTAALPAHPDERHARLTISGEVPSALDPPSGCRFHPRCPHAMPQCAQEAPVRKEVAPQHTVACHLY